VSEASWVKGTHSRCTDHAPVKINYYLWAGHQVHNISHTSQHPFHWVVHLKKQQL